MVLKLALTSLSNYNNLRLIYQFNRGQATAGYTGSARLDQWLCLQTHRLELRHNNFFVGRIAQRNNAKMVIIPGPLVNLLTATG